MAFNPNVSNKKQIQDSPFLTLSQRSQKGITSDNIFGNQKVDGSKDAKGASEVNSDSIFARQADGGLRNQEIFGQPEEKSGEEYLQENENGDVNFDENGFYDDAWGINLGNSKSSATDPIKAGSSNSVEAKDTQEKAKDELKTALENGGGYREVSTLKDKAKAAGVEDNEIERIEKDTEVKAGSGNAASAKAGSAATNPYEMSPSQDVKDALSGTPDMAKAITSGAYVCHKTGGSSTPSSSAASGAATETSFMSNLGTTIGTAAVSKVGGEVAGAVMKPITDPISKLGEKAGNWTSEKLGLGKEATNLKEAQDGVKKATEGGNQIKSSQSANKAAKSSTDASKSANAAGQSEELTNQANAESASADATATAEKEKSAADADNMSADELEAKASSLDAEADSLEATDGTEEAGFRAAELRSQAETARAQAEAKRMDADAHMTEEAAQEALAQEQDAAAESAGVLADEYGTALDVDEAELQTIQEQTAQLEDASELAEQSLKKNTEKVEEFSNGTPNQGHVAGGAGDALGGLGSNNAASSFSKKMIS